MTHPGRTRRSTAIMRPALSRSAVWLALAAAMLLPAVTGARAQLPSQSLVPAAALAPRSAGAPAVACQPVNPPAAPASCLPPARLPPASIRRQASGRRMPPTAVVPPPAAMPVAVPVAVQGRSAEQPLPDRGRQIIELQLAHRPAPALRPQNPAETTAMWRGYVNRIGKAPGFSGSGSGTGSTGTTGSP